MAKDRAQQEHADLERLRQLKPSSRTSRAITKRQKSSKRSAEICRAKFTIYVKLLEDALNVENSSIDQLQDYIQQQADENERLEAHIRQIEHPSRPASGYTSAHVVEESGCKDAQHTVAHGNMHDFMGVRGYDEGPDFAHTGHIDAWVHGERVGEVAEGRAAPQQGQEHDQHHQQQLAATEASSQTADAFLSWNEEVLMGEETASAEFIDEKGDERLPDVEPLDLEAVVCVDGSARAQASTKGEESGYLRGDECTFIDMLIRQEVAISPVSTVSGDAPEVPFNDQLLGETVMSAGR